MTITHRGSAALPTDRRIDIANARLAAGLAVMLLLGGCLTASPTPTQTPSASVTPSPISTERPTSTASPTATPEPAHSLDLPADRDPREVRVAVAPALTGDGGTIAVTVTNLSETRIDEIVLRWATDLADELFLAPFVPSAARVAEFGPPLTTVTEWTKWVEGPGEEGEPAGTTSLGYGPMDPGMTLEITLYVTRRADGPVAFDLQVLDNEALLTLEDGAPAELRVSTQ